MNLFKDITEEVGLTWTKPVRTPWNARSLGNGECTPLTLSTTQEVTRAGGVSPLYSRGNGGPERGNDHDRESPLTGRESATAAPRTPMPTPGIPEPGPLRLRPGAQAPAGSLGLESQDVRLLSVRVLSNSSLCRALTTDPQGPARYPLPEEGAWPHRRGVCHTGTVISALLLRKQTTAEPCGQGHTARRWVESLGLEPNSTRRRSLCSLLCPASSCIEDPNPPESWRPAL